MKKIWKPVICLVMAFVIGASGLLAGALPAYGETEAVNEAESGMEAADPTGTEVEIEEPSGLESEILLPVESDTEVTLDQK